MSTQLLQRALKRGLNKVAQAPDPREQFDLESQPMLPFQGSQSDTAVAIQEMIEPRYEGRNKNFGDLQDAAYLELFNDANLEQIGQTIQDSISEDDNPRKYIEDLYESASSAGGEATSQLGELFNL